MIRLMKLVVGLGNPGKEYQNNRHNVGFMAVDWLANQQFPDYKSQITKKFGDEIIHSGKYLLVKPQMFMNRSGEVVAKLVNFYKIRAEDLWVIHDDLDIALGEYKIQQGIGPKVHNGLISIEEKLGTKDFWRVRVGVDNRPTGSARTPGEDYVLTDFTEEERKVVDEVIASLKL